MQRACQSAPMMQFGDDGCAPFLHTSVSTLNAVQLVCGELKPKANSETDVRVGEDDAPALIAQTNTIIHSKAKFYGRSWRLGVAAR